MSFRDLEEAALGITQSYFGETVTYTQGDVETEIKAVFNKEWVESNGVSTYQMTCAVVLSDLPSAPAKSDTVTRGSTVYKVGVSQPDAFGGSILILKD